MICTARKHPIDTFDFDYVIFSVEGQVSTQLYGGKTAFDVSFMIQNP